MSSKYPIPDPPNKRGIFAYSKQAQDSQYYQNILKQREKEADRQEKTKERISDRRFNIYALVIGAILGSVLTKLIDFIF
jgi:hypothetical protein